MVVYVIWTPALRDSKSVKTFNRKWMGYSKRKHRSVFTFIQTAYLFVNTLEMTVVHGLFLSNLMKPYATILLSLGVINIVARFFIFVPRFVKYWIEGIRQYCQACCEETQLNYGDDYTDERTEVTPLNPNDTD